MCSGEGQSGVGGVRGKRCVCAPKSGEGPTEHQKVLRPGNVYTNRNKTGRRVGNLRRDPPFSVTDHPKAVRRPSVSVMEGMVVRTERRTWTFLLGIGKNL